MADKYSTILGYFNNKVNQADIFKNIPFVDNRENEIVYKDIRDELGLTKMPISKIVQTVGITPSAKSNGEYEPIGTTEYGVDFVEPLFQKTVQLISVDEMDFYLSVFENGGKDMFLADKAGLSMSSYDAHVANQKKMGLTAIITQQIRDEVNNTVITGKTINYGTLIGAVDTANDSGTFDISAAGMTKEKLYNYMEEKRAAKYKSTGAARFRTAADTATFMNATDYALAFALLSGQQTGNAVIGERVPNGFDLGGYLIYNLQSPYSLWAKGAKDVWALSETNAIAAKYMQMIDVVNGKHMQRNLRVATTDGSADRMPYYMELVQLEDKSGWKLLFRAKPLIVFDTTASISRQIHA